MKHALILCSGGIDSVTTAYLAQKKKYASITLMFCAYGQPQVAHERKSVRFHAHNLKAHYVELKLSTLAHLTRKKMNAQKRNETTLQDTRKESVQWFVPGRNTVFIAHALAYVESHFPEKEVIDLYLGFKNEGKNSFSDTTQEYVRRIQRMLKKASKSRLNITVPLITNDKEDIIKKGVKQGINYATTWSCYQPAQNKHCGLCLACRLRKAGFKWANVADPTSYAQ